MANTFIFTTDNATAFVSVHGEDENDAHTKAEASVSGGLGDDSDLRPIFPADHHPALKEVEDTLILACCVCVGIKGNRSLADFLLDPELAKHKAEIRSYQAKRRRPARL
jgi:hypothetical protein